jgi:hypothetical protein
MDTVDGERGCWQVVDVFAAEGYIYRGTVQIEGEAVEGRPSSGDLAKTGHGRVFEKFVEFTRSDHAVTVASRTSSSEGI